MRFHFEFERQVAQSIGRFTELPVETQKSASEFIDRLEALSSVANSTSGATGGTDAAIPFVGAATVYQRAAEPKGPMGGFGYDYLEDHVKRSGLTRPELLEHEGLWGDGGAYAYEALNLVDGKRTVEDIRDRLSAIYGPVPIQKVGAFLDTLEKIGVLKHE